MRWLGRDLARALGTDAVMSSLRRQEIGPFRAADALALDALTFPRICDCLIPPVQALAGMPQVVVTGDERQRIFQGREILNRFGVAGEEVAALTSNGDLVAILNRA